MKLTKEQALEQIKGILGDKVTEDTSIKFIEDMTDTLSDLGNNDADEWKKKYEENDASWRKKYTDRFFNTPAKDDKDDGPIKDPEKEIEAEANAPKTFDDLFKESEK